LKKIKQNVFFCYKKGGQIKIGCSFFFFSIFFFFFNINR